MPIHKEGSGYQWGNHGKVYPTRKGAEKQAAAAHAHGYREDNTAMGMRQLTADEYDGVMGGRSEAKDSTMPPPDPVKLHQMRAMSLDDYLDAMALGDEYC